MMSYLFFMPNASSSSKSLLQFRWSWCYWQIFVGFLVCLVICDLIETLSDKWHVKQCDKVVVVKPNWCYLSISQSSEVRFDVKHYAVDCSLQRDAAYEKNYKHDVGKSGCKVDYLAQGMNPANEAHQYNGPRYKKTDHQCPVWRPKFIYRRLLLQHVKPEKRKIYLQLKH